MIKISIMVAAYNVEKYIERCMDSLVNQTLRDIEIIVVNDGSTDETLNKILQYSRNDKRVIVIDKENEGLIEARKSGIENSNGEYLLFVDGDDWIAEDTCEKLYSKAISLDLDIVNYGLYYAFDDRLEEEKINDFDIMVKDEYLKNVLLNKIRANIVMQMVKRNFFENNKIIFPNNISYAEDLAITIALACNKPKVATVNEPLYYYYQRENSITNKISKKVFDVELAIKWIENILEEKKYLEIYKNELEYLKYIHLYYYRVIAVEYNGPIHKELYDRWKAKNINIKKNNYIISFEKNLNLRIRIKLWAYDINYNFGAMYSRMYRKVVSIIKVSKQFKYL